MQLTSVRRVAVTLAIVGIATAIVFASVSARSPGRGRTEEVLTGEELAAELGLVRHDKAPDATMQSTDEGLMLNGVVLTDCAPNTTDDVVLIQQLDVDGSSFYCVHADSEIEGWIIGQKLNGHIPTDEEIKEMEAGLEDLPPAP